MSSQNNQYQSSNVWQLLSVISHCIVGMEAHIHPRHILYINWGDTFWTKTAFPVCICNSLYLGMKPHTLLELHLLQNETACQLSGCCMYFSPMLFCLCWTHLRLSALSIPLQDEPELHGNFLLLPLQLGLSRKLYWTGKNKPRSLKTPSWFRIWMRSLMHKGKLSSQSSGCAAVWFPSSRNQGRGCKSHCQGVHPELGFWKSSRVCQFRHNYKTASVPVTVPPRRQKVITDPFANESLGTTEKNLASSSLLFPLGI